MGAARTLKNAARPFTGPRINTQDMPSAPMGTGGGMPLPPQQPMSNTTPNKGAIARAVQASQQQQGGIPNKLGGGQQPMQQMPQQQMPQEQMPQELPQGLQRNFQGLQGLLQMLRGRR